MKPVNKATESTSLLLGLSTRLLDTFKHQFYHQFYHTGHRDTPASCTLCAVSLRNSVDVRPLSNQWDIGRTIQMATERRDILSMTLQSHLDDSYHIRNLVVELSDFWIIPEPVHTHNRT